MNKSRLMMSAWAKDSNSKSLTNAIRETNANIDVYSTMASTGPTATLKIRFTQASVFHRNLAFSAGIW